MEAQVDRLMTHNTHLQAEMRALQSESTGLSDRIRHLQTENAALTTLLRLGPRSAPASGATQDFVRALTQLAAQVHPDRHGGAALATELTQAVLKVRDEILGALRRETRRGRGAGRGGRTEG